MGSFMSTSLYPFLLTDALVTTSLSLSSPSFSGWYGQNKMKCVWGQSLFVVISCLMTLRSKLTDWRLLCTADLTLIFCTHLLVGGLLLLLLFDIEPYTLISAAIASTTVSPGKLFKQSVCWQMTKKSIRSWLDSSGRICWATYCRSHGPKMRVQPGCASACSIIYLSTYLLQ